MTDREQKRREILEKYFMPPTVSNEAIKEEICWLCGVKINKGDWKEYLDIVLSALAELDKPMSREELIKILERLCSTRHTLSICPEIADEILAKLNLPVGGKGER